MHITQYFQNQTLIVVAVFAMVASLVWWLTEALAARKPRTLERLDEFRTPRARRNILDEAPVKKQDAVSKAFEKASPALAKSLVPKSEAELSKLKIKLSSAGFRSEHAGGMFMGLKFVGLMAGLALGAGSILPFAGLGQKPLLIVGAVAGVLFYFPDLIVMLMRSSRKNALFLGLPDALDLMVVCVEAGLGLDQAMRRVSEEMKRTNRVLSEEFGLSNFQLQMGRPKNEVLRELGVRTDVSDLRSLSAVLIQADRFGSSVALALRVQSDSMRTRRRQMAEEKAAKTAVKLIFPLVLFIFPGIFVVLVGPAAITMARQMLPAMGG